MRIEDERDRVCRQGADAWRRLKRDKNYSDWIKVGEALQVGREWAMNQAGVNRPEGKGYNVAFSEWLAKWKLDDLDKGDRSRLFRVMDNLPQIEEWRHTLTLTERLKLNHPNAVLRKWDAFMKPEDRPEPGAEPKPTLRDSVANLSEENRQLKEHIADLEAARETATGAVPAGDLVAALRFLVQHMDGIGVKQILASGEPGFDSLDLVELAKRLKETTAEWKAQQRGARKAPKADIA